MSTIRIARIFVAAAAFGLGACAQAYGTGVVYVTPDRSVSETLSVVDVHGAKYPGGGVRAQLAGRP